MSEMIDQQKLIEGQMQLEDEAKSRARRIKMRRQRQAKLAAMRKAKRRARAFKLAGLWSVVMLGGFFALAWFSNDVMALIAR
tara:strand:- start:4718 stop:4963 length:246 start_codon:yes stop_codon:yes gene_type:complete